MTQADIVKNLKGQLSKDPLRGFELEVFEPGIRQDGDWWYVPINPKNPEVSSFDYAPQLGKVEDFFEKSFDTKVLLIPASGVGE